MGVWFNFSRQPVLERQCEGAVRMHEQVGIRGGGLENKKTKKKNKKKKKKKKWNGREKREMDGWITRAVRQEGR